MRLFVKMSSLPFINQIQKYTNNQQMRFNICYVFIYNILNYMFRPVIWPSSG
jgi:hypothetical protein